MVELCFGIERGGYIVGVVYEYGGYFPACHMAARVGVGEDEYPRRLREFLAFGEDGEGVLRAGGAYEGPYFLFEHTRCPYRGCLFFVLFGGVLNSGGDYSSFFCEIEERGRKMREEEGKGEEKRKPLAF